MDILLGIKLTKNMKKKKNPVGRPPIDPDKRRIMVGFTLPPLIANWLRDRPDKSQLLEKLLQKEFRRSSAPQSLGAAGKERVYRNSTAWLGLNTGVSCLPSRWPRRNRVLGRRRKDQTGSLACY